MRVWAPIATAEIPGRWWCLKLYTDLFLAHELQHKCILNFLDESKSMPSTGETGKKETSSSLKWDKTEGTMVKKDVHFEI